MLIIEYVIYRYEQFFRSKLHWRMNSDACVLYKSRSSVLGIKMSTKSLRSSVFEDFTKAA